MTTKTIDITPKWREILPALLALLENANTRDDAIWELSRMAGAADAYVAQLKAGEA
jgi:hypothetical protein